MTPRRPSSASRSATPTACEEFLTAAQRLASNGRVQLKDAVFVVKKEDGATVVRETLDPQPGRTAISGAVWASLLGLLLGGPVGWLAGGAIGGGRGGAAAAEAGRSRHPRRLGLVVSRRGRARHDDARAAGHRPRPRRTGAGTRALLGRRRSSTRNLEPYWLDRIRDALGEVAGADSAADELRE